MDGLTRWLRQLELGGLIDMVVVVIASLLCITIHETCHGLVAWWLGDDTAKSRGRLSLNPLRHVDIMGLVMMALVRFGWAKPVPIDMRKFRRPKQGMALTALAGPVSNVLLAFTASALRFMLFAVVPYEQMGTAFHYVRYFLECIILLSAGLAVFNLFPIPPLDGSKILFAVLPDRWYIMLMRYERYGMFLLAVLLLTNVLDVPLLFLRGKLLDLLTWITEPLFYFIANRLI